MDALKNDDSDIEPLPEGEENEVELIKNEKPNRICSSIIRSDDNKQKISVFLIFDKLYYTF